MSRYYAIAKDVVAAHGGAVEKFIGDAVMAVFGLRQAHGDDAALAIAAAFELRDRVRSDPRLGDRLPIRLGVNTNDPSPLEVARDLFERSGAVPFAARARCEAAIIRHDGRELDIGLTYLDAIRDARQVERYLRADRDAATAKESI